MKPNTIHAPRLSGDCSLVVGGIWVLMAKDMQKAGTIKFTTLGRNKAKNVQNSTRPFCQTISVVMSPKGLKAPPALAATTILIAPKLINWGLSLPTARSTAHNTNAVVKLSKTGDKKNAQNPVSQNKAR